MSAEVSICLSHHYLVAPAVQSRSLHSLHASRVLHVTDHPFSTVDDNAESLRRHLLGDRDMEDISSLMGKLGMGRALSNLEHLSLNNSQQDEIKHFHGDPITGHIATVTLDPHHRARLKPHADDM